jgi:hypothetical protein
MSQSANPATPQQGHLCLHWPLTSSGPGGPGDAIVPLRDAAQLQPSKRAILHDLGLPCLEVGRIPDAIAALQGAVASNPRYADAYFRLGIAFESWATRAGRWLRMIMPRSCSRPRLRRGSRR